MLLSINVCVEGSKPSIRRCLNKSNIKSTQATDTIFNALGLYPLYYYDYSRHSLNIWQAYCFLLKIILPKKSCLHISTYNFIQKKIWKLKINFFALNIRDDLCPFLVCVWFFLRNIKSFYEKNCSTLLFWLEDNVQIGMPTKPLYLPGTLTWLDK